MEIQVGEYVRTKQGYIAKLLEIDRELKLLIFEKPIWKEKYNPKKTISFINFNSRVKSHSFNIIDLIEIGDYVNGEYVTDTWNGNRIETHRSNFHEDNIKSIVTKEAFESIKYEV